MGEETTAFAGELGVRYEETGRTVSLRVQSISGWSCCSLGRKDEI